MDIPYGTLDDAWNDFFASLPASVQQNIQDAEAANSPSFTREAFNAGWQAAFDAAQAKQTELDAAIAAGDGTLHGAIDYWQERALKAEAAKANGGWMPIESAPRDEQVILLASRSGHVIPAYRDTNGNYFCMLNCDHPILPFTHWQHLPPPPEQT